MGQGSRWQCFAGGWWLNYPVEANAYIRKCYDGGASECKVQLLIDGKTNDYTITFGKMTQQNDITGRERKIRAPYASIGTKDNDEEVGEMGENVKQKAEEVPLNSDLAKSRAMVKNMMEKSMEVINFNGTKTCSNEKRFLLWIEQLKEIIQRLAEDGLGNAELQPLRERLILVPIKEKRSTNKSTTVIPTREKRSINKSTEVISTREKRSINKSTEVIPTREKRSINKSKEAAAL